MKREDFVKLGVEEELAKKLETASLEELKGFIPKARFDEVNNAKNTAEALVKERDNQIEKLKNSTGDADSLRQQIQKLQDENKTKDEAHAAEIKKMKIDNAVTSALTLAKAKNPTAVRALLKDLDKAEIADDGTIKGLSEQLEALKKSDEYLFEPKESKTKTMKGAKVGDGSDTDPTITKEQFNKMSYKERLNLYNDNKELYDELSKNE